MFFDIEKYQDTIRQASYDDANGVSLIDDEKIRVYLLDEISKEIAKEYEIDIPSSCDALCTHQENIFIIEFKNREYKDITPKDKRDIRKKAYRTPEILLNNFYRDWTMDDLAKHAVLLIVFKNMQNKEESFGRIVEKFNQWANESSLPIKCKLAKFKGVFYKDVHTIGKEEFEEKFLPMLV